MKKEDQPDNNDVTEDELEESDYDANDDSSDRGRGSNGKKQGLKPKAGGVNQGMSKKQSNAVATSASAYLKTKINIKSGPVQDPDLQKKRTKERTITEIIEKVSTWRKLYNGVMIPNKDTGEVQLQRWSLEDAAAKVKVSKKSLDDYLLQLRFGKKFGFDFEKYRDSKVGVLRSFVKE